MNDTQSPSLCGAGAHTPDLQAGQQGVFIAPTAVERCPSLHPSA